MKNIIFSSLIYIGVSALAAATLGFELVQTRVLSALYYNHVVYFTITIAFMGFGISGVIVSLAANRIKNPDQFIARLSAFFALVMLASIAVSSRLPEWMPFYPTYIKLILSYLLLVLPFLCSGAALGFIFMRYGKQIFSLYCCDLSASACMAVAFILLLMPLGAGGFVWLCVALAAAAFVALSLRNSPDISASLIFVGALTVLFAIYGGDVVGWQPEPYKVLGRIGIPYNNHRHLEVTKWTPIARIDVINNPRLIAQDSDAYTLMSDPQTVKWIMDIGRAGKVFGWSPALVYAMHGPADNALVIGVGGGIDILVAGAWSAKHITGAEINPATVKLTTGRYADYLVWPHWPNVNIVREEGRHFVRSATDQYDTITMSGIDTFTALNSGAYVLSENYLYTVGAIKDYLKALKPDGMMVIHRWFFNPPRESLRLASLYVEAAHRMNIPHPEQDILVVADESVDRGFTWASTFIKKTPFTRHEIDRLTVQMKNNSGYSVVYMPKIFPYQEQKERENVYQSYKSLEFARNAYWHIINDNPLTVKIFADNYPYNITPVDDDRPFFFEYTRGESLTHLWKDGMMHVRSDAPKTILYLLVAVCALVSLTAMIGPLVLFNRKGLRTQGVSWLLLFFSCLGLGFMLVEIGIMQRLALYLGDPMYSLIVVLAGLLFFTGIGAYVSGWLDSSMNTLLKIGTFGAGLVMLEWLVSMPMFIAATRDWSFPVRSLITLLSLMPVGLIMGLPFAVALSHLKEHTPRFIPWAWGVNGLTSVLGSILAIIIAMSFGFAFVIMTGAACYFIGGASIIMYQRAVYVERYRKPVLAVNEIPEVA